MTSIYPFRHVIYILIPSHRTPPRSLHHITHSPLLLPALPPPIPLHLKALDRAQNRHHGAPIPRQRRTIDPPPHRIQIPRNRRRNHPARGARARREPIHLAQHRRAGRRLLDQDQQQRIHQNRKEVAHGETRVDGGVQPGVGHGQQPGHEQVGDGVEDGDGDEEAVDADALGEDREDDGLHDEGDGALHGHDHADGLEGEAEAAGGVEESLGGEGAEVVGGDAVVFEEDGEEVVEGHGVVGEDGQSQNDGHDALGEDAGGGALLRVGLGGWERAGADGAVVIVAQVDSGPLHGVGRLDEGCVFREERVVGEEHARLHVGVGFFEEEVAEEDAQEEHTGTKEVREEVGEALKQRALGEEVGVVLVGVGKGAADGGADDGADGPDEGHDGVRLGWGVLASGGLEGMAERLTFVLWFCDELANHGLDDGNVSVEKTANDSSQQGHPDVGGKANHDHAEHGPNASQQEDGLAADSVRETSPVHAHQGLSQRERRDEEAGVERGIVLVADLEPLDESPGIGKDGGEGNGLGKPDNGCSVIVRKCLKGYFVERKYSPRRNSWAVGKASGSRAAFCPMRAMFSQKVRLKLEETRNKTPKVR